MNAKQLILAGITVLSLIIAALPFAPSGGHRYRAASIVIAKPYTNVFFGRSFERHVIQTIPGVLLLSVTPSFSAIPASGAPVLTNGVGIRIFAVGSTPENAQRAANEAAAQLCRTVLTNYGVSGAVVDVATSARSYSYFHDSFQPGLERLFKH